jgi:CHAT domain-containing protein/tetratricopeptide (TPR) repeat protein
MTDLRRAWSSRPTANVLLRLIVVLSAIQSTAGQSVRPGSAPRDDAGAEMEFAQRMGRAMTLVNVEHKIPEAIAEAESALRIIRGRPGPQESQCLDILAQLHGLNRDLPSRRRVLGELIIARSKLVGPDHWSLADLKFSRAETERIFAMPPETYKLYMEAAQHLNRGNELTSAGKFEDATVLLEQARAFYREFWDLHPDHAMCIHLLGVVHRERRQYARARELFEQALALRRKLRTDRHPRTVDTLNALAWLDEAEGDLARSRRLFESALALHKDVWKLEQKQLDQTERAARANLLERLARVKQEESDLSGARDVLMQAVAARGEWVEALARVPEASQSTGGGRSSARGPSRLSSIQGPGPRLSLGEPATDTRVRPSPYGLGAFAPRTLDPHATPVGNALMDTEDEMAMTMNPTHPWSLRKRAWYAYRLAVDGFRGEDGVPDVLGAPAWIDLAIASGKLRGRPCIDFARSLGMLADVLRARGDLVPSRRVRLLSLAIGLEATDPSDATAVDFAHFLEDFDRLLIDLGELNLARDVALLTVGSRRSSLGARHPDYAAALEILAMVLWREGDLTQAMLVLEKALAVRRSVVGEQHFGLSADLDRLALLHAEQGDDDDARRCAAEALTVHEALIARTLPSVPERIRLALLARSWRSLATFLDLTASDPALATDAYTHLIAWKGIATEAAAAQAAAARSPKLRALIDELNAARDELSRLYHLAVPRVQADQHAQRVADQVKRRDDLEARLAEALGWKPRTPRPDEVAAALPEGSALVDISRYVRRIPPTADELESRRRTSGDAHYQVTAPPVADAREEPRYVAFVVRPGRASPERLDLGPAEPIDQAVNEWLERVEHQDERAVEETGRRLRRAVWEPLAPLLVGATRVLVSPDGLLNFLPWGALPGQGPGTYLVNDRSFATVIAARQLVASRQAHRSPAGGLLTVGGVNYGKVDDAPVPPRSEILAARTRSALIGTGSLRFDPLKATEAETQKVEEEYRHFAATVATPDVMRLTGSTATKRRILQEIPGRRFLHLATHGYFAALSAVAESDPDASFDPTRIGAQGLDVAPALFPGLLSGLVFAGANFPTSDPLTGTQDFGAGIMTAEEVTGLELSTCELAVLSACETGRGRVTGGEGVIGLQRSFHAAGARTVIASLWKVDDEATRELMTSFYDNLWRQRLGPLEALRQAQLSTLRGGTVAGEVRGIGAAEPEPVTSTFARTHPRFWAAWVLSGDPGESSRRPNADPSPNVAANGAPKEGPTSHWPLLALPVVLLVALAQIAWLRMRRVRRCSV